MENMLKRIVDMDKQAQRIIDDARQEKLHAEQDIARQTEQLRQNYLDQTRRRIRINAENEQTIFRQNWRRREAVFERQRQHMTQALAEHGEEWAQTLAERVIQG